jgi:hypothetical protein
VVAVAEPLTPEREAIVRQQQPGDWLAGAWTIRETQIDGTDVWQVVHAGQVLATLPDWAGNLALWIAETHEDVPELLATIDRLRADRDAFRAEVLNEAADAVVVENDRMLWATKPGKHWAADLLRRMATSPAPAPPVPDNTTGDECTAASTTVACTCLGGPTLRDGQVLHSGYCDTVVHAPWTPQREAAIRATAKEGAGSLHSALGATVPNEDVLAVFLQLDEARKELARRTPTGDEGEGPRCTCGNAAYEQMYDRRVPCKPNCELKQGGDRS